MGVKQIKKYQALCDRSYDKTCLTAHSPNAYSEILAQNKTEVAEKLKADGWSVSRELSYAEYDGGKMDWTFECPPCVELAKKEGLW